MDLEECESKTYEFADNSELEGTLNQSLKNSIVIMGRNSIDQSDNLCLFKKKHYGSCFCSK